jgi:hypothetical protein
MNKYVDKVDTYIVKRNELKLTRRITKSVGNRENRSFHVKER